MFSIKTDLTVLTNKINALLKSKSIILLAIDGRCTSGKTTLAGYLENIYDCNVFHMDDFFLTQELRTAERLSTPGGNIDYERFLKEVLIPVSSGNAFYYSTYDCHSQKMNNPIKVSPKHLNIIEGTYSMHPVLENYYDLSVFLSVDTAIQYNRILQRNPKLHDNFFQKWIPMEEIYFSECNIKNHCSISIDYVKL